MKSPIVGTFYEASAPGTPPFVKVGDSVEPGQVLCIIESMKLMNEIEAEAGGVIAAKLVENEWSILDLTDLVFIDPVSTGYSRPAEPKDGKLFHGVDEDLRAERLRAVARPVTQRHRHNAAIAHLRRLKSATLQDGERRLLGDKAVEDPFGNGRLVEVAILARLDQF